MATATSKCEMVGHAPYCIAVDHNNRFREQEPPPLIAK